MSDQSPVRATVEEVAALPTEALLEWLETVQIEALVLLAALDRKGVRVDPPTPRRPRQPGRRRVRPLARRRRR